MDPHCLPWRLLKHFSRREKQATFVAIGALRVYNIFKKSLILASAPPRGFDPGLKTKSCLKYFHIYCSSTCMSNSSKNIDNCLNYCETYFFNPNLRGKFFDTAMLTYRHWAIMVYSEKLLNIIALRKCEDHNTNELILVWHFNCLYQDKGNSSSVKGSILMTPIRGLFKYECK